ncbi:hypothetical protein TNCV_3693091 [Trichonephila clavipes]|nr:hypothetical protein TNCV_3693091 [Trichonephila clavipes]
MLSIKLSRCHCGRLLHSSRNALRSSRMHVEVVNGLQRVIQVCPPYALSQCFPKWSISTPRCLRRTTRGSRQQKYNLGVSKV